MSNTFISEIFGGSMVEVRTVHKDTTGNREPFMILPLVIKVCGKLLWSIVVLTLLVYFSPRKL